MQKKGRPVLVSWYLFVWTGAAKKSGIMLQCPRKYFLASYGTALREEAAKLNLFQHFQAILCFIDRSRLGSRPVGNAVRILFNKVPSAKVCDATKASLCCKCLVNKNKSFIYFSNIRLITSAIL